MADERAKNQEELEQRIRDYIDRLEKWQPARPYAELKAAGQRGGEEAYEASRDHWLQSGMDEAYDNVLDQLYGLLGEER